MDCRKRRPPPHSHGAATPARREEDEGDISNQVGAAGEAPTVLSGLSWCFWDSAFCFHASVPAPLAAIVLTFAFAVELSQLYRAEWIDAFRETVLGAVMIGSGFLWSDFACHAVGCAVGVAGEMAGKTLHERRRRQEDRQLSSEFAPCVSPDEVPS